MVFIIKKLDLLNHIKARITDGGRLSVISLQYEHRTDWSLGCDRCLQPKRPCPYKDFNQILLFFESLLCSVLRLSATDFFGRIGQATSPTYRRWKLIK